MTDRSTLAAVLGAAVLATVAGARAQDVSVAQRRVAQRTAELELDEDRAFVEPGRNSATTAHCGRDRDVLVAERFGPVRELGSPGHEAEAYARVAVSPDLPPLDTSLHVGSVLADTSPGFVPRTCVVAAGTVRALANSNGAVTVGGRLGFVSRTDGSTSSLRIDLEAIAPTLPSVDRASAADLSRQSAALAPGLDDVYALSALSFAFGGHGRIVANLASGTEGALWIDVETAFRVARVRTEYGDREGLSGGLAPAFHYCQWWGQVHSSFCFALGGTISLSTFYTADIRLPFQGTGTITWLWFPKVSTTGPPSGALRVDLEGGVAVLGALPTPFTGVLAVARLLIGYSYE